MTLYELAQSIVNDLGLSQGDIPNVRTWLQFTATSRLNVLLPSKYVKDGDDVCPNICGIEAAILYQMYLIYYYSKEIKNNLGAAQYDWSEIKEGDSTIRRVSKNEVAKTYLSLKRDADNALRDLIFHYRQNKATPLSIYYKYCGSVFEGVEDTKSNCPQEGCN